jgi:hypothetical protein
MAEAHPPTRSASRHAPLARGLRRLGAGSLLLGALLAIHLGFGVVRFWGGAVHKRVETIADYQGHGELWFFRFADDESQRLVRWLLANVPNDQVVLYDGKPRNLIEALHPALFPRSLLHRRALRKDGTAGGRPVFLAHPPWLAEASAPGWVHSDGTRLRWRTR